MPAPRLPRAPIAAALVATLAACGGSTHPDPLGCAVDADCGASARCIAAACVAAATMTVDVRGPTGPVTTNRIVRFEAAAGASDAASAAARYAWTIAPLSAGCAAEPEADGAPAMDVIFWCAGQYSIQLVVTDDRGRASAPIERSVDVLPAANVPRISPGLPISVEHRCGGVPLRCDLDTPSGDGRLPLPVTADSPLGDPLAFEWISIPPDPSRAGAVVAFFPSPSVAAPSVFVETAGGPISGAWRLRLRARDPSGLIAQAFVELEVGNRPPILAPGIFTPAHSFAAGRYVVHEPFVAPVVDPDNDPLEGTFELLEVGANGCTSSLAPEGPTRAVLDLGCALPGELVGGVARRIDYSVSDPNGGGASGSFAVQVANRPPALSLVGASSAPAVDHSRGTCPGGGDCFIATGANPFRYSDPDGDPVATWTLAASKASAAAGSTATVAGSGATASFTVATPVAAPLEFRSPSGATDVTLSSVATDPFGGEARIAAPLTILNRPPVRLGPAGPFAADHLYDPVAGRYVAHVPMNAYPDADGDPLTAVLLASDPDCGAVLLAGDALTAVCSRPYDPASGGRPPLAGFVGQHVVTVAVADPWEGADEPAGPPASSLLISNRPPVASPYQRVLPPQRCVCSYWDPTHTQCLDWAPVFNTTGVIVPIGLVEPDSDPVVVTFSPTTYLASASVTGLPGSVHALLSSDPLVASWPVYTVTVDDGVATTSSTTTVVKGVCN